VTTYTNTITTQTVTSSILSHNVTKTCFRPDVAGNYDVRLTVTDGCARDAAEIDAKTIKVKCNAQPTAKISGGTSYTLEGTAWERVTLDGTGTKDADDDVLNYKWIVTSIDDVDGNSRWLPINGTAQLSAILSLSNSRGPVASFTPDRPGTYKFQLHVDDGCSSSTSDVTINVDCSAGNGVFGGVDGVYEALTENPILYYNKQQQDAGLPAFGTYIMETSVKPKCYMESTNWDFDSVECYTPPPAPAPTPPPTPQEQCVNDLTYTWQVVDKPCKSSVTNSSSYLTTPNAVTTDFLPDVSGSYTLRLFVEDGCSSDQTFVTIEAKCKHAVTAAVTAVPDEAIFDCTQHSNQFGTIALDGSGSTRSEMSAPAVVEATCAASNTPIAPANPTEEKCCPACPQCPQCPTCPACPEISGTTKRLLEKEVEELEKQLEQDKQDALNSQAAQMTAVTAGVGVTLAILLIASAVVNVVLFMKINKGSGGAQFDKGGDVELSSTPVPASEQRI
jgi:hypothetical protein